MSFPPEGRTEGWGSKVTERPLGLDEPLVSVSADGLLPSGCCFGRNAEPGAFRLLTCTPFYPQRCGHPLWGQREVDVITIFRSALVGGLAAGGVGMIRRLSFPGGCWK